MIRTRSYKCTVAMTRFCGGDVDVLGALLWQGNAVIGDTHPGVLETRLPMKVGKLKKRGWKSLSHI